ncbi:hypothetical protein AVEN_254028-1 [Araneus ventricosus]|uniref:Uncharacterized protein n=1 Tax=Araneus ventricosus TaxID=182803 RepID=A0A4Y2E703_ARAVE|nr:hypothetical protein AVEN_254028-1 [Araneus ventricosus]
MCVDMCSEEAFRDIVDCGVIPPQEQNGVSARWDLWRYDEKGPAWNKTSVSHHTVPLAIGKIKISLTTIAHPTSSPVQYIITINKSASLVQQVSQQFNVKKEDP